MASKSKLIYIIRDKTINEDSYEEIQSNWLDENYPGNSIIAGEKKGEFLVNEENTAMMCTEYIDLT